ncbi:MAG: pyruvate, phosphate dikinase, partial [Planctomycetota bacterium]
MAKAASKLVYSFGAGKSDGSAALKNLLGGKGANLGEMARRGFNVPPGFTITTEVCTAYYKNKKKYPQQLAGQVKAAIAKIEKQLKKGFGDEKNPLLVAVRSGSRESMPGIRYPADTPWQT